VLNNCKNAEADYSTYLGTFTRNMTDLVAVSANQHTLVGAVLLSMTLWEDMLASIISQIL